MAEITTLAELRIILGKLQMPSVDYTEILPGLVMGAIVRHHKNQRDQQPGEELTYFCMKATAKDTELLTKLGVTHIINSAYDPTGKGNFIYVDTNEEYYTKRDFKCQYLGVRAVDTARFNLSKFFDDSANFIESAIMSNGVAYIHCFMGMSRCAALVIAYLIIKQNMTVKDAVTFVRSKREIYPNDGFLQQLLELGERLRTD